MHINVKQNYLLNNIYYKNKGGSWDGTKNLIIWKYGFQINLKIPKIRVLINILL